MTAILFFIALFFVRVLLPMALLVAVGEALKRREVHLLGAM